MGWNTTFSFGGQPIIAAAAVPLGKKIIRQRGREEAISNNTRLSGVKFSARLFLLTFHEFAFIAKRERSPLRAPASPRAVLSPEAVKPLMSLKHYGWNGRASESAGNKYPFFPGWCGRGRARPEQTSLEQQS